MAIAPLGLVAPPASSTASSPSLARFGGTLRAQLQARPAASAGQGSPLRATLEAVERARARLDDVLAAARRGQTFTARELLALQADAYRYSQTLEVASKVVEQGAQAVKHTVNTQV
jgi:hypothetical protein